MTIEEQLKQSNELLRQVLSHTSPMEEEEVRQNQEEIDNIDETIEKYEQEAAELTEKLSNEENYRRVKSDFETNERPVVIELLAESISLEREDIFKSNQLYRKEQEQQTKMLGMYNSEVSKLKEEINNIEARLNKDEIAKKRGIAKKLHLSDSEVIDLKLELSYKQELIEQGNQVMEICAEEIRRYGKLITENNSRLKALTEKEQRVSDVLSSTKEHSNNLIDKYQLRLDKDKLSKTLAALQALKNRKEFLLYNPSEEIKKQIRQNEEVLAGLGVIDNSTVSQNLSEVEIAPDNSDIVTDNEEVLAPTSNLNDVVTDTFEGEVEPTEENKEVESEESKVNEETKAVVPVNPTEDVENNAKELISIEDAPNKLKKQKMSDKIKKAWKKWREKAIAAAVAAAITITAGMSITDSNEENIKDDVPTDEITQEEDIPVQEEQNFVTEEVKQPENINNNVSNVVVQTNKEEVTPEIPEVEMEVPEASTEIKYEGVINNDDIETTVLQSEGELVNVLLENGDYVCVKYGDTGENVPEEIVIKYVGTDMYIYSPIVHTKSL